MKKALVLVAILLLTSGLAWAEGTASGAAAPEAVGQANSSPAEGGCTLPDFTGLSPDQQLAAALAAGFQLNGAVDRQVPVCPTVFSCTSITNCGVGAPRSPEPRRALLTFLVFERREGEPDEGLAVVAPSNQELRVSEPRDADETHSTWTQGPGPSFPEERNQGPQGHQGRQGQKRLQPAPSRPWCP
jgi:hypothetical protein